MAKPQNKKPKARLVRGFEDIGRAERALAAHLTPLYEMRGFVPLDTPAIEYTDALGQFLPDADRPNRGVFSWQDEDEQWLSLRYDLTAPLARYVAQHYESLPKPFRRYQFGPVWRNEKAGAGRYREFWQMDADIVDAPSVLADAELCLLGAAACERLGLQDYQVRLNHRRLLDGVLADIGLQEDAPDYPQRRLTILRAMDKLERLGEDGVRQLLGKGRKDASGDVTQGANLDDAQSENILAFLRIGQAKTHDRALQALSKMRRENPAWAEGMQALEELAEAFAVLRAPPAIVFDFSIVRGLDYYTGAVFEISCQGEAATRLGALGGGGRYDELVARFRGAKVPASGMSLGLSRIAALLTAQGQKLTPAPPPILVAVLDAKTRIAMMALTEELREAGIAAETYLGEGGLKAQLRYADKRAIRFVLMEGEDERQAQELTLKDMASGKAQAAEIADNKAWRSGEHAQIRLPRANIAAQLVAIIKEGG